MSAWTLRITTRAPISKQNDKPSNKSTRPQDQQGRRDGNAIQTCCRGSTRCNGVRPYNAKVAWSNLRITRWIGPRPSHYGILLITSLLASLPVVRHAAVPLITSAGDNRASYGFSCPPPPRRRAVG